MNFSIKSDCTMVTNGHISRGFDSMAACVTRTHCQSRSNEAFRSPVIHFKQLSTSRGHFVRVPFLNILEGIFFSDSVKSASASVATKKGVDL